jgi:hypothetical protein
MKNFPLLKNLSRRVLMPALAVLAIWLWPAVNAAEAAGNANDFSFVQVSDTHIGFNNPAINPDWQGSLKKVIAKINSLNPQPDFVVFTGDLTHTTDDPQERRKRMTSFRDIIKDLKVKDIRLLPGEHDAGLDKGEAYKEIFGETHYTFDHKGVHFIVIDNVSDPSSSIGEAQLKWLGDDLKKLKNDARIIVFTHRPLFDLYPDWDWWTRDGAKALELLKPYKNVNVFYGHIHQENNHLAENVQSYAAKGTMYPLPAPGSVPKKAPIPWDQSQPYKGLGFRSVSVKADPAELVLTEYPVSEIIQDPPEQVIKITAKKFEYSPNEITVKKGVPVTLEFVSLDVLHGFNCPGLEVRADIPPGKVTQVRLMPQKAGVFAFHCDNFCGEGHENMTGKIIVE